jgi:NTP pyrophosphatase (non-canonical NTP hydrolase)
MTKFSNHSEMAVAVAGQALQRECHKAAYEAGWWHQQYGAGGAEDLAFICRDPKTTSERLLAGALIGQKLALIHSEVSEALEGARKNRMDDHLPHRKSIEVELADAVIRIADLAGALGLDLGGAIAEKMAYNAQRADHKPENRAANGGKAF